MDEQPLAVLLEFATDLAWKAGRTTLAHFQTGAAVEFKDDASPVTIADREAERLLRDRISKHFPADAILGEEFGASSGRSGRRWIIDPIDGTRSWIRGVPLFGTLVALEIGGRPVIGVIHLPALGETVCAAEGQGCWWNGRRARVSATADLAAALVLTSDAGPMPAGRLRDGWERVAGAAGTCRTWGDCYGYALVATGRAEAMIDPVLSVWDAAAMMPIIREAGGVVTDANGAERHDTGNLVATNALLSEAIRTLFGRRS